MWLVYVRTNFNFLASKNLFKTEIKIIQNLEVNKFGRSLSLIEKEEKLNKMFDMLRDNAYAINNDENMFTDF